MYAEDCPEIARFAVRSPENLFRVGLFVQMTINQHFEQVPLMVKRFDEEGLSETGFMGWQQRAVATLWDHRRKIYSQLLGWKRHGANAPYYAIKDIVEYPGFGIIKGAFFAQLVLPWTVVGCLDRHNIRMYGLAENAFNRIPASAEGLSAKIRTYLDVCKQLGGSQVLWDNWCTHVAKLRPKAFISAQEASRLHVECIVR